MDVRLPLVVFLLSTGVFFSGCINNPDYQEFNNIQYRDIPGTDINLISLDIYSPINEQIIIKELHESDATGRIYNQSVKKHFSNYFKNNKNLPVMIWIHGGGWRSGDKANQLQYKIPYFINEGWIFVSVNYRLSPYDIPDKPEDLNPDRIKYPIHNQDVAAAISWVHENIQQYGGNPNNISLMGHSAGAGIVSAIGTNQSHLEHYGLNLSIIQYVISLDTAAYDIRERCETGAMLYLNAFGTDPTIWDAASPSNNIEINETLPSFFIVVQGTEKRINQNIKFIENVNQTGAKTQLIITSEYDHSEVNQAIGNPEDKIITPELSNFLGFENNQTFFKKISIPFSNF